MWWQLFSLLFCIYIYKKFRKSKYVLPPGPPKLPLIGSLISVLWADSKQPTVAFSKLSKKYGHIVSLQMGSVPTVVINGHAKLMQISNSEHLLSHIDESDKWIIEKTNGIPLGIIFAEPDVWAPTRAYSTKTLRKYGFSEKSKMGELTVEEFVDFCDHVESKMVNGQTTLTLTNQFEQHFFGIIWALMTGDKFNKSDPRQISMVHALNDYVESARFGGSIAFIFPELVPFFPKLTGFQKLKESSIKWRATIQTILNEERKKPEFMDEPTNFLQEFLQDVDRSERPSDLRSSIFTDENIAAVVQDLCIGGTDVNSKTMKFFIRYLLQYPEVQDKLFQEINRVVGKYRNVTIDDIPSLVYTQATMFELTRMASTADITPRKLLSDWEFDGYLLPKGTFLILNIWSGNRDETYWEDAVKFDPNRFISPDGELVNTEKIVSFGFGKRKCFGEALAKTSIVLVAATLIQRFSFHVDPAFGVPNDDVNMNLTRDPVPFNVLIKSREL